MLPILSFSQMNDKDWETEIDALVEGVRYAYSKDVSTGSRVFILSLKKDDGVSAYCRSRLEAELLGSLNETKFNVVFQPFLLEKTLKFVESTDTTFKVFNQSSYAVEFGNMRTLMDSLKDYNIDLVMYSKLFLAPSNNLILKSVLVDLKTLEVISSYTFYGTDDVKRSRNQIAVSLNFYHGQAQNSIVSRSYGPSQALSIDPFNTSVLHDGMSLGFYQYLFSNTRYVSAGVLLNLESNYLNFFDDYIYDINEFQIRSISIAPSLGFHLKNLQRDISIASAYVNCGFAKSELNRSFYYVETELRLHLSKRFAGNLRVRSYLSNVEMFEPFYQNINYNSTQLCAGFSVQL